MRLGLLLPGLSVGLECEDPRAVTGVLASWRPAVAEVERGDVEYVWAPDGRLLLGGREISPPGDLGIGLAQFALSLVEQVTERNRDAVLLHAAALEFERHVLVFVGDSTAGKSSFSRASLRVGARYLADDFLVLRAGRLTGIGRTVQFDVCERSAVPSYFADCELLPYPSSWSGGVDSVLPLWTADHAVTRDIEVGEKPVVICRLHRAQRGDRAVTSLDPLERLAAIHGASLTVGAEYDGGLGFGPSFDVAWLDPDESLSAILERLRD